MNKLNFIIKKSNDAKQKKLFDLDDNYTSKDTEFVEEKEEGSPEEKTIMQIRHPEQITLPFISDNRYSNIFHDSFDFTDPGFSQQVKSTNPDGDQVIKKKTYTFPMKIRRHTKNMWSYIQNLKI